MSRSNDSRHDQARDPAVLVVWGLVALILVIYGMTAFGHSLISELFYQYFAFIPLRLAHWYGFPSLFLHVFLHGNFTHLAVNLGMLVAFGLPLVKRVRSQAFLAIFFFSAGSGALLEFALNIYSPIPRIGASGGVAGLIGALCAFAIVHSTARLPGPFARRSYALRFIGIWLLLNFALGFLPGRLLGGNIAGIAWAAHIGGFLGGLFLNSLLLLLSRPPRRYDG